MNKPGQQPFSIHYFPAEENNTDMIIKSIVNSNLLLRNQYTLYLVLLNSELDIRKADILLCSAVTVTLAPVIQTELQSLK